MDENPYESPKASKPPRKRRWEIEWKPKDVLDFAGYGALFGIVTGLSVGFCDGILSGGIAELPRSITWWTVPVGGGGLFCGIVIWAMRNSIRF